MLSMERELSQRLREAGEEELTELVHAHRGEIGVPEARQILRNPHATREVVEVLLATPEVLGSHEVKKDLAAHPQTPQPRALDLVPNLFWRDLVRLGADSRVRPAVRRAANRTLASRLPGLATGEKSAIARTAGPGLLARLRHDPSPRVLRALLQNPRLTEGTLLPVASSDQTPGPVLEVLADDRRWGVRYPVRRALANNPATPPTVALRLLPHLKKHDLRSVARATRISAVVRRRAKLFLGEA